MSYILITLKSDTCTGSGEIYNCLVDSDVCYDKYGLPYIPAKRLKGCLREAAQELLDWGYEIDIDRIFGVPGNHDGKALLRISNGNLYESNSNSSYESYVEDIMANRDKMEITQQSVLEQFAYMRTQTAMENGVAKRNSLRSIRVLKKGLVFRANVSFSCEKAEAESYREQIEKCCKALKNMGLNRTRGMGEVSVTFHYEEEREEVIAENIVYRRDLPDDRQKLWYTISLKAPLLTRSISAGQAVTENYIEGAKILGFLVHHVGMGFEEFMGLGELICSNAYISQNGIRYVPVSEAWNTVKNESEKVRDRTVSDRIQKEYKLQLGNKVEQLKALKDIYVKSNTEKEVHTLNVSTEIRYHHARPKDKSIGHANAKGLNNDTYGVTENADMGEFYQLESLCEGQQFTGYIIGSKEQMKAVEKVFKHHKKTRMGYNRSSEYGEVEFSLVNVEEKRISHMCKDFILKLEAPMIQYSESGVYTTESKSILEEVKELLKPKWNKVNLKIEKEFVKFKMLRGYNTKWNMNKPVIYAFDKGTTFVIHSDKEIDLAVFSNVWLGERVNEGFGEISVYPVGTEYQRPRVVEETVELIKQAGQNFVGKTELIKSIIRKKELEKISSFARKDAKEQVSKSLEEGKGDLLKPVVHEVWLWLMDKRDNKRLDINELLPEKEEKKEEKQKKKNSDRIKAKNQMKQDLFGGYSAKDSIAEGNYTTLDAEEICFHYMQVFLEEMKYLIRAEKVERRQLK